MRALIVAAALLAAGPALAQGALTGGGGGGGSGGGSYTLPAATAVTLGGVTVSTGLNISSGALSVLYGTTAGTAAQGNDNRITGALQPGAIPAASGGLLGGSGTAGQAAAISLGSGLSLAGNVLTATSGGGGSVTSVSLALPSIFGVSGSPVTGAGTLTATLASQSAGTVLAAPAGSAGTPSFRALTTADLSGAVFTALTGDVVASGTGSVAATLASVGTAGTYGQVTTDAKGRVTSGTTITDIAHGGTGSGTAPGALTGLGAAPVASPALTGTPTAPTPTAGDSTTKIATTAFATAALNTRAPAASTTGTPTLLIGGTAPTINFNADTMACVLVGPEEHCTVHMEWYGLSASNAGQAVTISGFPTGAIALETTVPIPLTGTYGVSGSPYALISNAGVLVLQVPSGGPPYNDAALSGSGLSSTGGLYLRFSYLVN